MSDQRTATVSRPDVRGRPAGPFDRPLTSYYLLLACTGLLLGIGLVMVLSTSSAFELDQGGPPYGIFIKQLGGALVGLAAMYLLSRTPPRVFRAIAYPALLAAIASLLIVLA